MGKMNMVNFTVLVLMAILFAGCAKVYNMNKGKALIDPVGRELQADDFVSAIASLNDSFTEQERSLFSDDIQYLQDNVAQFVEKFKKGPYFDPQMQVYAELEGNHGNMKSVWEICGRGDKVISKRTFEGFRFNIYVVRAPTRMYYFDYNNGYPSGHPPFQLELKQDVVDYSSYP